MLPLDGDVAGGSRVASGARNKSSLLDSIDQIDADRSSGGKCQPQSACLLPGFEVDDEAGRRADREGQISLGHAASTATVTDSRAEAPGSAEIR